jgi:hypothetical protein
MKTRGRECIGLTLRSCNSEGNKDIENEIILLLSQMKRYCTEMYLKELQ